MRRTNRPLKLGGEGLPRIDFDSPKPPRVKDHYKYWGDPPPELSERCQWWVRHIEKGWRPNRRIRAECYDCSAEWYGIYIWEFIEVICPALQNGRMGDRDRAEEERRKLIPLGPLTFEEWFMQGIKIKMLALLEEESLTQILYGDGSALIREEEL